MPTPPSAETHLTDPRPAGDPDTGPLQHELRVVLGRLIRRLRCEHRFPLTQAAVLGRLDRDGGHSIGTLAARESVRPQSMSQTVCELEAAGLVSRQPDATDARRTQVLITARGRAALDEDRNAREGWLRNQIDGFSAEEQETLRHAVSLLRRLTDTG
ncbi:MAG: MarR family winged helix-turn-helix transcriptional regulator [Solirubrobacteraceae bacterium]